MIVIIFLGMIFCENIFNILRYVNRVKELIFDLRFYYRCFYLVGQEVFKMLEKYIRNLEMFFQRDKFIERFCIQIEEEEEIKEMKLVVILLMEDIMSFGRKLS